MIALSLGDPLPPRHAVENVVNEIVTYLKNMNFKKGLLFNEATAVGAMWILYYYFNYRDE